MYSCQFKKGSLSIVGPLDLEINIAPLLQGLDLPTEGKAVLTVKPANLNLTVTAGEYLHDFLGIPSVSAMTVRKMLLSYGAVRRAAKGSRTKQQNFLREWASQRTDEPVPQNSGGERQRVAIARSLLQAKIILGMKPTGNLTVQTHRKLLKSSVGLHMRKGNCVIIVTQ